MGGLRATAAVDAVAAVDAPTVFGLGFGALLFVLLTGSWAESLIAVAHEGGHVVASIITFRGHRGFKLDDGGGASTKIVDDSWGPGDWLVTFVGYPTPGLLGLGGAALIADGNLWGVLWIAVLLLIASFTVTANLLAGLVTLLILIAVGWTAVAGSAGLQVGVAVFLVWWLLIGGLSTSSWALSRADKSDAYWLARRTLVPRIVWHAIWALIGLATLVAGARLLIGAAE